MHAVDTNVAADFVKVDVTGLSDRIVQVDFAVTSRFPVAITMCTAWQAVKSDANGAADQVGCTGLKCGER